MTINTDIQTLKKWYERGTLTEKEFGDATIKFLQKWENKILKLIEKKRKCSFDTICVNLSTQELFELKTIIELLLEKEIS